MKLIRSYSTKLGHVVGFSKSIKEM